ncbi:hypothetical protein BV20DRAFT_767203 [Pilatotrama ljubarskyi]|nr:hypothetical protein BV20DRAFT_767203 [Pilatotrama ljubarskyi]
MLLLRTVLFAISLGAASASVVPRIPESRDLHVRDTVNGSCISAPDNSCVSLVGLCVAKIASGQVASTVFWSDSVCVAAATCAGMGSVLDAACCAGTCRQPTDIASLDYSNIYFAMVGECAFQPGGCSLTWQPFVDWFYNTVQATGTNIYPDSGDNVLSWWADIATWTGFCEGNECADSAIPYTNFDDWFHFSSSVLATSPGTPVYVPPFPTLPENMDNWTPNILWPCLMDDPGDCWWDYGPPIPGTLNGPQAAVKDEAVKVGTLFQSGATSSVRLPKGVDPRSPFRYGRAEHQPANVPPPVYANGQLVQLHLNSTLSGTNASVARAGVVERRSPLTITVAPAKRFVDRDTSDAHLKRAITPDACKTSTDVASTLPTLTYYCSFVPNICANIRSHPDWNAATDQMDLTYDPFDNGRRRTTVCTETKRAELQEAGSCDPLQHDPYYWKVSCDEFPFSSSLEGGAGNSVVMGVPTAEQDLQGTLQSSITYLRSKNGDGRTSWGKASKCHRYTLKLVNTPPAGAPPTALGSVDAGSQFFAKPMPFRYVKNKHASDPIPPTYAVDTPYQPSQTAMTVPKLAATFDCSPCDSDSDSVESVPASDDDVDEDSIFVSLEPSGASPEGSLPTAAPDPTVALADLDKRQQSSCTRPSTTAPLPTTSAEASAVAAASSSSAKAAAAAAAAALASASNPSAAEAAAAAAAVAAADALVPVAAALASSTSDSALAAAIAASQQTVASAQTALNQIFSLGPDIPDWLSQIVDQVSSATSAVTSAVSAEANVIKPATPVPPDVDPSRDPVTNSGPPAGAPPAACFGAGSKGFLKIGDTYFVNENGKAPATLVDVGSDAYFGLTLPTNRALVSIDGCNGVYQWQDKDLQPDFQVDCSTMELGSYWNGVKQTCYSYSLPSNPDVFDVICGNNIGNIYTCLQIYGAYGDLNPGFITWATS